MIDTLRLSKKVKSCDLRAFDMEMITINSKDRLEAEVGEVVPGEITKGELVIRRKSKESKKFVTVGGVTDDFKAIPRLTYYPEGGGIDNETGELQEEGRLLCEVSLPKFLLGNNYTILDDQKTIGGINSLQDWVSDKVHTDYKECQFSRLDYCYQWETGDNTGYYLQAFCGFPVSGYTRVPYIDDRGRQQGFSWICKSVRVNGYDKGLEARLDRSLLRLELQNKNKSAIKAVEQRVGSLALAGSEAAKCEIRHWLYRAGIAGEFRGEYDIYDELLNRYGLEGAQSRFFFIYGYKKFGVGMMEKVSIATYKRRLSEAKKNDWFSQAEKILPKLEV